MLYLQARGVPALAAGLASVGLLAWVAAEWLTSREWAAGAVERWPVATLAPVLAAVLVSAGLAGADEELERTTAVPWRRIRVVHVIIAAVAASAALVPIGLWEPQTYGAFELVRNTGAAVGLVAAASVVLGARPSWVPVTVYTAVVAVMVPGTEAVTSWWTSWWAWPVQPWSATHAGWAALAAFTAGLALYGRLGARPSREEDTA